MTTCDGVLSLDNARTAHRTNYGSETEARSYADDLGASYCENCYGVFLPLPGYENDGHDCHGDGSTREI